MKIQYVYSWTSVVRDLYVAPALRINQRIVPWTPCLLQALQELIPRRKPSRSRPWCWHTLGETVMLRSILGASCQFWQTFSSSLVISNRSPFGFVHFSSDITLSNFSYF